MRRPVWTPLIRKFLSSRCSDYSQRSVLTIWETDARLSETSRVFSKSNETVDIIHAAQMTKSTGDRTARSNPATNKTSIATAQAQLFATCRQTVGNKCPGNTIIFSPKTKDLSVKELSRHTIIARRHIPRGSWTRNPSVARAILITGAEPKKHPSETIHRGFAKRW